MSHARDFVAALCLIVVVWVTPASAQRQQDLGHLEVRLSGDGALVMTAEAVRETGPTPVAITGSRVGGVETFANLLPGRYRIASGGLSRVIHINARERVVVDQVSLRVTDRQYAGEGLHLGARWFDDLASAHDVWGLIETTVPFVIADRMDNGGLGTGRSALLGARGSSWTTTQVTWAGASVLLPNRHGLIPYALDLTTTSAVSVISGLAPVEFGTPGVVVALTPRAPASVRRGDARFSLTTPGMAGGAGSSLAPPSVRTDRWMEGAVLAEGPVGRRTSLLISGARSQIQFHERSRPTAWTSDATTFTTHLVTRPADDDQVRVLGTVQRVAYPFEDRRQFLDREVLERGTFWHGVSTWNRRLASGTSFEGVASLQSSKFHPSINAPQGGTLDRVTDGVVPAPATETRTTQWELGATVTSVPRVWAGARHHIRVGGSLRRASLSATTLAAVDVAEMVAGLPARVWRPQTPAGPAHRTVLDGAAYISDRLAIGSSLTLDAGVRAEWARGTIRGGTQSVTWPSVSPRLSAQWQRGPVALFAGAGWYSDPLSLSQIRHGDPGEVTVDVYRWHDRNSDRVFSPEEAGVRVARAGRGPDVASIDPDLRAPRTREYTGGVELRLGPHVTMRSAAIWRRQASILGSVNTGVPSSAYVQRLIPDAGEDWDGPDDDHSILVYDRRPESFGLDRFVLTNPADGTATYEGLESTWHLRTRRVEMLFGATAYRTRSWAGALGFGPLENDHGVIGDVFEQPNARPLVQGSNFFDRSYVGKWAGTVHLPFNLRAGFAARYQDGQPFSRVVVVPDLSTGPEMVHAYRTGRTRYTYALTLDVRVQKILTVAGHHSSIYVDVFNATNHKNEVDEDALTTVAFRRSTARQPPVTARIGLTIGW